MNRTVVTFILMGMLAVFCAPAEGADWVLYIDTGDGSKEYYDKTSITRPSQDSMKVSTKLILSQKQKQRVIEASEKDGIPAKDMEKLSYLQSLYLINCIRKQFQVLSIAQYDIDGNLLRSDDRPEDIQYEWEQIPPNAVVDHLRNAICPGNGKK
jgi:hypothetical protein